MIIAATDDDMTWFATARHLTSRAGVRPGNPYLKGTLGLAAFGALITVCHLPPDPRSAGCI